MEEFLIPDITGNGNHTFYGEFSSMAAGAYGNSGAFLYKKGGYAKYTSSSWSTNYGSVCFDASASNSLYKNNTNIQPLSFQTLIIIKV